MEKELIAWYILSDTVIVERYSDSLLNLYTFNKIME